MCHGSKSNSGKTIKYKSDEMRHKDAIPYSRSKSKKDFQDYFKCSQSTKQGVYI
jgi:hypothetical protein